MKSKAKVIGVLNGPNLNLLGTREPQIYGKESLEQLMTKLEQFAKTLNLEISHHQSNREAELIEATHSLLTSCQGMIVNPGAFGHTSIALRDALSSTNKPVIEVHLSNVYKREAFRHHSYLSEVVSGTIAGLGSQSYLLALQALSSMVK